MTILLFMKKKNGSNVSNTYKLFIMWGYRKVLDPFSKISPTDKTDFFFFQGFLVRVRTTTAPTFILHLA